MTGQVTSAQLRAVSSAARQAVGAVLRSSEVVGSDVATADGLIASVRAAWGGPRADGTIATARDYLSAVRPASAALVGVASELSALAADADGLAARVDWAQRRYDQALWLRLPDGERDEESIWRASADLRRLYDEWDDLLAQRNGTFSRALDDVRGANTASLGDLPRPQVTGDDYAYAVAAFAGAARIPLSKLALTPEQLRTADGGDGEYDLTDSIFFGPRHGYFWGDFVEPREGESPDAYYDGGGFIVGPDGRVYPIVIPTVVTDDGTYTADQYTPLEGASSVANLGGTDDGWVVVDVVSGVERFYDDAPGWALVPIFAAGEHLQEVPPESGLDYIVADPNGGPPYFAASPPDRPTAGDVPSVPPSDDPTSMPSQDWTPSNPPEWFVPTPPAPPPLSVSVADIVPTIGAGVSAVTGIDNGTHSAYQVVFEQNEDGRVRARVDRYALAYDADGEIVIVPQHLYVNTDGDLYAQTVEYGTPYIEWPVITATGRTDAVPGYQFDGEPSFDFDMGADVDVEDAPANLPR